MTSAYEGKAKVGFVTAVQEIQIFRDAAGSYSIATESLGPLTYTSCELIPVVETSQKFNCC